MVDQVRKRLQYDYSIIVNPMGIWGGLILIWDEEVKVEVEFSSREIIDVMCKDINSGIAMRIYFLHASTNFQERLRLWQTLHSINLSNNLPWIYIGDFNEVPYEWEKVGRREAY